jgi:hypothetical protein
VRELRAAIVYECAYRTLAHFHRSRRSFASMCQGYGFAYIQAAVVSNMAEKKMI